MDTRTIKLSFVILAILLVNIGFVLSLSVSSPYYKDKPLEMYPGQEREILFSVQNCPSLAESCNAEDIKVVVNIEEGSEIAQITSGESYTIDYGSNENIKLKMKIPSSIAIGTEYSVKFTVASVPEGSGGVQLGLKYNVEFPIIIKNQSDIPIVQTSINTGNEEGNNIGFITIIILLSVVILIIAITLYKFVQKGR